MMNQIIEIVEWAELYETHRTRELLRMEWVPMRNKQGGDGYTELLNHPNGAAHFGAWCALLEVGSRCSVGDPRRSSADQARYDAGPHPHGRGLLIRTTGEPHDAVSLERMTRIPRAIWEEVLPRLLSIGWIRFYDPSAAPADDAPNDSRDDADQIGDQPRDGAQNRPMKGIELKGKEGGNSPPVCEDLKAINPALSPTAADMARIEALSKEHGRKAILEAYQRHQSKKPGQALRFFFEDLGKYLPRKTTGAASMFPRVVRCPACKAECGQAPGQTPGTYVCRECSKKLPAGEWHLFKVPKNGAKNGKESKAVIIGQKAGR